MCLLCQWEIFQLSCGSTLVSSDRLTLGKDMSTSVQVETVLEKSYGGVGRCKCSFWFAVAHDILGVLIMMVGVFGGLVIHDLFIYAGALIIFLSLIWWVFWYSGNIDVPSEELEDDVGMIKLKNKGLSQVVRRVSGRLSNRIRNSFRKSSSNRAGGEVSLCTVYDSTMASSSKEIYRETLSIWVQQHRLHARTEDMNLDMLNCFFY